LYQKLLKFNDNSMIHLQLMMDKFRCVFYASQCSFTNCN